MSALPIRAVLFDLDGTLVDTEAATDTAIEAVLRTYGIAGASLPARDTRGRTWRDVSRGLIEKYALDVAPEVVVAALDRLWVDLTERPEPIPGAAEAIAAAARHLRVGVVSSSSRAVIHRALVHLDRAALIPEEARVGAEDVVHPKPAPEGFLLAARRMGIEPAACLVFEDSRAGLEAARAAGMARIAVLHSAAEPELCRGLADNACKSYLELDASFFSDLALYGRAVLGSAA